MIREFGIVLPVEIRCTTSGDEDTAERIFRKVIEYFNSEEVHDGLSENGSIHIPEGEELLKALAHMEEVDRYES